MKLIDDHEWPESKTQHLFGPWMQKTDTPPYIQYRMCVHPNCGASEEREYKHG